ncbi:small ribosomal subunit protein uS5m [Drosophila nasuta]|uniref:Small ribosomal subunit protein uS5m n=1 Tax=Drosophila albomicans TaxID=7291 RepID=A0A6P8XKW7_DROAB|nr:28S ribosomal protein S5, mitochondrial [Drosophila albomicans]XP_060665380.1 small ribosomal subunit protein uS5m [Drosophila nasuta]
MAGLLLKSIQRWKSSLRVGNFVNLGGLSSNLLISRSTSFFNKLPAEDIWRGVTAVSNAGKKRGRGKGTGKKIAKDLNKGQAIGIGKKTCIWPGLNAPIIRGNELLHQQKQSENIDREKNIQKIRDSMGNFKQMKINPIDRGWSGTKMPGRSIGPPDTVGEEEFTSFDTFVLENKIVFIMKGNMGRKRRYSVLSVTGNKNGLAGFALAKGPEVRTALRKSKNRAGQKLMSINLYENRTINHDFYTGFGKTKIFVSKKPDGYGLVCHRALQTICKAIGIRDLHAKIEGSTNLQHIVKAFFIGLMRQKTYQDIANESCLHIVESQMARNGYTEIKASPHMDPKNADNDRIIDFMQFTLGNKIVLRKKSVPPFYAQSMGYTKHEIKKERFRNQANVRLHKLVNNYNYNYT